MIGRYWNRASKAQKIVLTAYFVLVLINSLLAGFGVLGAVMAIPGLVIIALVWSGIARLYYRHRNGTATSGG